MQKLKKYIIISAAGLTVLTASALSSQTASAADFSSPEPQIGRAHV